MNIKLATVNGLTVEEQGQQIYQQIQAKIKRSQKEQRDFKRRQMELEDCRDIRDDIVSLIRNWAQANCWTFDRACQEIHARCGPHPSTIKAWADKTIAAPRQGKQRSVMRIIGVKWIMIDA